MATFIDPDRGALIWVVALLLLAGPPPVRAASYYVSPDVPTATVLPWEAARHEAGGLRVELRLPPGTAVDALHRMDGGDWLISVPWPTELPPGSRQVFQPGDVIRYDGAGYAAFVDGSAVGLPLDSNVDALFLDGGDLGDLVLSFELPTTIGGVTYAPADLVRLSGGSFSPFFDGSAAGPELPVWANVTGADRRGAQVVLTLDVPITPADDTFLPGELVAWDGAGLTSFQSDSAWPVASRADGLAFLADPGQVPATLRMAKSRVSPGELRLSWTPSCSQGAEDYAIYEGRIGSWYSHAPIDCSDDGGDLAEPIKPSSGNRYYLIVPHNPNDEGSYGIAANGAPRPRGATVCVESQEVGRFPNCGFGDSLTSDLRQSPASMVSPKPGLGKRPSQSPQ